MAIIAFKDNRDLLLNEFDKLSFIEDSGQSMDEIEEKANEIIGSGMSHITVRAKIFELILMRARIAANNVSCYAESVEHNSILPRLQNRWRADIDSTKMRALREKHLPAMQARAYDGNLDFGHISPDWESLFALGFPGLIKRLHAARKNHGAKNAEFYDACETVCGAIITYLGRLEAAVREIGQTETALLLHALSERAPQSLPEAYQMIDIMYFLITCIEGENLRSLGRLDRLLYPMYASDISSGRYTKEELAEYTRHFFAKMHAYKFNANVPFVLGGIEKDGTSSINEYSYFLVDVYRSMKIHDPKMQVRVSKNTPYDFVRKVLLSIRDGLNSFVFVNDEVTIRAIMRMGVPEIEARDYLLIGCYEPAVAGREIPCTCNGTINYAQVVLAAINNGMDVRNGVRLGPETGKAEHFDTFEKLMSAVKAQYEFFADGACEMTIAYEHEYEYLNPAPLLSSLMPDCVENGRDVYLGSAKYNNSSINNIGLATAVDSLAAIRKFVYDEKSVTLSKVVECLEKNWVDNEILRLKMLKQAPKFGNADTYADDIASELTRLADKVLNGRPNGRGGYFRSGLFSIDWNIIYGEKTGATPDGRVDGEPLSKNLCAGIGRDKAGVTALMKSVSAIDFTTVPNGSVLDVTLHPSSVQGEDGMDALAQLLDTYFCLGCYGVHFNIMDAAELRAAQKNPEKYASLQVRVCGWNAHFVNLSEAEQNIFIMRAEAV